MAVVDRNGPIANAWVQLADDAPVSPGGSVIVSLNRLKNEHNSLFSAATKVGVEIGGDVNLQELEPFLPRLAIIVVRMNNMRDGRLFSIGRLLRQGYSYTGDLRATGGLIPDQVLFLWRCGFTSFELPDNFPIDSLKGSVGAYTHWYQHGTDNVSTVSELRRAAQGNGSKS